VAHQFVTNLQQGFLVGCYMNTKTAATGTVSLFLTWTDNVGVKTSAAYTMNTASTTTGFLSVGPIPISSSAASSATKISYYTTITGSGFTYGVTCHAIEID
jgi:hypothetical protein